MKKIILFFIAIIGLSTVFLSCKLNDDIDSVAKPIILPFIDQKFMQDAYIYGLGQATLNADLPEIVATAVDTVFGMVGGHGGRTGKDTLDIHKGSALSIPDLTKVGGSSIQFEAFNNAGYKVKTSSNVVVAGPISDPGPTALEGTYTRTSNSYKIIIKKVFDGVYVIGNPGGSPAVAYNPYLLYNHKDASGKDLLSFPIQSNLCPGGGIKLVDPTAPAGLTVADYDATPPIISNASPLTLQWKVFEFASTASTAIQENGCSWGASVRTFIKD